MTNEEIREAIQNHQLEIQKSLVAMGGNFELNPEITKHKKAIDKLRRECTHVNTNHEVQSFNGRCIFCGSKV